MPENLNSLFAETKAGFRRLPSWAKVMLVAFISLLLLTILAWLAFVGYVYSHKKELLTRITTEISEHIDGQLEIKDIEPALLQSFPNVSVRATEVRLSDSLYPRHQQYTIDLKAVYIKLNILSLLTRHPEIVKVTLANGSIHLFTDKQGYTNTYLFQKKPGKKKSKNKKQFELSRFGIDKVTFIYDHEQRDKQFKVTVNHMDAHIHIKNTIWEIDADTRAYFHQLGFNLTKGGFLTKKTLKAPLKIIFDRNKKELKLPEQLLLVDDHKINFAAVFKFDKKPAVFTMLINAPAIPFREGASMLSRHIAKTLDSIDVKKPIAVKVSIDGSFQYPDTPEVHAYFDVKNNTIITPFGEMDKAMVKGEFTNYYVKGRGKADNNSAIIIPSVQVNWQEIPVQADSILIISTLHPLLTCRLRAQFPVEKLDAIAGNTFTMAGGQAAFDLSYSGPVASKDTFEYSMHGYIHIRNASLTYLPRSLSFNRCNATLVFTGKDMHLEKTTLSSRKSTIQMEGTATDFMNAYFTDPGKVVFDWKINSNLVDLNEFRTFLAPRKKAPVSKRALNRKISNFNNKLDDVLDKSSMHLWVRVNQLTYRKFGARNIDARLNLTQEGISIKNVHLKHAGGSLDADAYIRQSVPGNPFEIKARLHQVQVDKLFHAFENFGQTTIMAENLEGSFSGNFEIRGGMQETGAIINRSLAGKINFTLDNGALKNFPPLLSVQKFAFKKRNLSHITFKTLKNQLDLDHGKITIHPMDIESSVLHLKIQGIYALDKGTDISIEAPLRNPQKEEERIKKGLKPRKGKGIVLYLRAKDGEDGKVRIGWDPLKKGIEKQEAIFEDEEEEEEAL